LGRHPHSAGGSSGVKYPFAREFHESILRDGFADTERAELVESLEDFKENVGIPRIRQFNTSKKGDDSSGEVAPEAAGFSALHDPTGKRILLNPAKLFPLVRALQDNEARIDGVLVVHTNREGDQNEPIASGPWILKYLVDCFGMDDAKARLVNAFPAGEKGRLEGDPEFPEDFPVRREVASQVHDAILSFASSIEGTVIPLVVGTGGMGPLKDIVHAEVDLVFDHPPLDLSIPEVKSDSDARKKWNRVVERILRGDVVSRIEATSARARALDLAKRGDFTGAWAAVTRQSQSEADRDWLVPLHHISAYFSGRSLQHGLDQYQGPAGIRKVLQKIKLQAPDALSRYSRFALNAAFKVEAALQGDESDIRLVDALLSLTTLIDILVVTRGAKLIEHGYFSGVSLEKKSGKVVSNGENSALEDLVDAGLIDNKRPFVRSYRDGWFSEKLGLKTFFQNICALDSTLRIKPGTTAEIGNHLRALRNLATHQALDAEQVNRVREVAVEHGIWNLGARVPIGGRALFEGGLIDNALAEIEVQGAGRKYQELIKVGLLDVLRNGPMNHVRHECVSADEPTGK